MNDLLATLRLVILSIVVCCVFYPAAILAFGHAFVPWKTRGSLITEGDGRVVGSARIAQRFTLSRYFWPRPSAVDHAADAAGGSNLSPTNSAISDRAAEILAALGATHDRPVPADLVLASGSGLDPHVTLRAALYQADRVAGARGLEADSVRALVVEVAETTYPGEDEERIVNVLRLNLALDRRFPPGVASDR